MPTEVIKARLQTGQFPSARLAVQHIAVHEGLPAGLFAGFGSHLLRDLPFDSIEFTSYERLKMFWKSFSGGHEPQQHETAAIGALAGMLTAYLYHLKIDDTRRARGRVAVSSSEGLNPCSSPRYGGIMDCFVRAARERGPECCVQRHNP